MEKFSCNVGDQEPSVWGKMLSEHESMPASICPSLIHIRLIAAAKACSQQAS